MTIPQLAFRSFRKRRVGNMIWFEKSIKGLRLITQDFDENLPTPKLFVFIFDSESITTTRKQIIISDIKKVDLFIQALITKQ